MTKSNDRIPDTGYWQRRAKDILSALEAPSERKERLPRYERVDPTVRMEPVVIKEKNAITDPNSWLNRGLEQLGRNSVDAVLGEGTGNTGLDMALGLTGPGAAVGTVAAGNRPGVLDMLPGGGALKAAVIAMPKWSKVLARSGRNIAADDAVELTRDIAHSVLTKQAQTGTVPSREILMNAVKQEVDELGPFAGSLNVKEQAFDLVNRSIEDFLNGKNPALQVKSGPVLEGVSARTLDDVESVAEKQRAATRKSTANYRERAKQYYDNLDDAEKTKIDAEASAIASAARDEAEATGNIGKYYNLNELYTRKLREAKLKIINSRIKAESPKSFVGMDDLPDLDETAKQIIGEAGSQARKQAFEDAIASGMSEEEAVKVAALADSRARTAKLNELADANKTKKARKAQMEANKVLVYKKLPPGYRALVDERAEAEAVIARQKALDLGASEVEANKKYRGRKQSVIGSYTNEIVKSLGFKNASDPRLFTEDIPDIIRPASNEIPRAENGMVTFENLFKPKTKDTMDELEEYYNVKFMR